MGLIWLKKEGEGEGKEKNNHHYSWWIALDLVSIVNM